MFFNNKSTTKFMVTVNSADRQYDHAIRLTLPTSIFRDMRVSAIAYGDKITITPDQDGLKCTTYQNVKPTQQGTFVIFGRKWLKGFERGFGDRFKQEVTMAADGSFTIDFSAWPEKGKNVERKKKPAKKAAAPIIMPGAVTLTSAASIPQTISRDQAVKFIHALNDFAQKGDYSFVTLGGKLSMERVDVLK